MRPKVLTLYIGTTKPNAKETTERIIGERFDSFTVISGDGYFKGGREPMWFVRIATDNPLLVLQTAQVLRTELEQESVGIEYESRYYRCTAADPGMELRKYLTT
jgi:hypothetical protein